MTSAPVVSNSSPLICLERIEQIHLFQQLFGRIVVPPAVESEVSLRAALPAWVETQTLTQPIGPRILSASLGAGESEAISLALETQARLLILDDRPARRLAQALRLPVIGTLGLLLAAKQRLLRSTPRARRSAPARLSHRPTAL